MKNKLVTLVSALLMSTGALFGQAPPDRLPSEATSPATRSPFLSLLGDEALILSERELPSARFWLSGEYLLWWISKGPVPAPLVTTGDPANNFVGSIGQKDTVILLGNTDLNYKAFSGLRLHGGWWLNPEQTWGVDGGAFLLDNRPVRQTIRSDANGNPGIYLPINDVMFGEDSFTAAFPGAVAGQVTVSSTSRLWGAAVNLVRNWYEDDRFHLSFAAGFRHLNLEESIEIAKVADDFAGGLAGGLVSPSNPGGPDPAGSIITTTDRLYTHNEFYGGQLGFRSRYTLDNGLFFDMRGNIGLGSTHQIISIGGATTQQSPGVPLVTFPVGVLAQGSNSGRFDHDVFSVVPEIDLKLGYQVTTALRVFAGYNALFWSNVVRPGNQISRNVDERTIPVAGTFTPGFQSPLPAPPNFTQSSFWAQGLSLGMEFRY